jgi:hypothetical protein
MFGAFVHTTWRLRTVKSANQCDNAGLGLLSSGMELLKWR